MGFYIQDDYWKGIEDLPQAQQDKALGAMVRFFFTQEEPQNLKGAARTAFYYSKERIELARKRAEAGKSKRVTNANQNGEQNGNQNGEQNADLLAKSESKSENKLMNAAVCCQSTIPDAAAARKTFIQKAIEIYNSEFGTKYSRFPQKARQALAEAFDAGFSLDDVSLLVQYDSHHGDSARRSPNGIFGEHMETLLEQAKNWQQQREEADKMRQIVDASTEEPTDAWMRHYE